MKAIPFEIRLIAIISLLYVGGLILLTGRVRHLLPAVPLLFFYICVILGRFTKFEIIQGLNQDKLKLVKSVDIKEAISNNGSSLKKQEEV